MDVKLKLEELLHNYEGNDAISDANEGDSYLRTSPSALLTPSEPPPSP